MAVLSIRIFIEKKKEKKKIVATPTCVCGGFGSPYHFFFISPRCIGIRNTYLSNIFQTHSTRDLLLGKETAKVNENGNMF